MIKVKLDTGANIRKFRTFRNPVYYKPSQIVKANYDGGANTRKFRTLRNPLFMKQLMEAFCTPRCA